MSKDEKNDDPTLSVDLDESVEFEVDNPSDTDSSNQSDG
jgi:hypothetical protein